MTKNVTLLQMRNRIRERGEWRSPKYPDADLTAMINESLAHWHDIITRIDPNRYQSRATYSVVSGTDEYAITDQASDFLHAVGLEVDDSNSPSGWWSIGRFNRDERNDYVLGTEKRDVRYNIVGEKIVLLPKPNWSGNLRLNYIPTFADLVNDNDTVDSIHYWTEWVINDVAVKLCLSEETDPKPFMVERDRQQLRLTDNASMDRDEPKQVVDSRRRRSVGWWRRFYRGLV